MAAPHHTARFRLVPSLAKVLNVPTPALRQPPTRVRPAWNINTIRRPSPGTRGGRRGSRRRPWRSARVSRGIRGALLLTDSPKLLSAGALSLMETPAGAGMPGGRRIIAADAQGLAALRECLPMTFAEAPRYDPG
ncbi:hypothetical protein [Nonomuraea sp. NPDC003201]